MTLRPRLPLLLAAVLFLLAATPTASGLDAARAPGAARHDAATTPAVQAAPTTNAAPGTLLRWGGPGTTGCRLEGETFAPVAGECLYPVDLLADPGSSLSVARRTADGWRTARVVVGEYPYPVQHIEIEDEGKVTLSAADLARAQREAARVGALWDLRSERRFDLPLGEPLAELPVGGRFGSRRFFNGEPRSPHSGADYSVPAGTPVLAVADGRVVLAEEHFFAGKSVFLDHGDGLISMYFHLSGLAVREGEEVGRGEIVGTVGATGRATGPHLHFGLRWRGARIAPADLMGPPAALPSVID